MVLNPSKLVVGIPGRMAGQCSCYSLLSVFFRTRSTADNFKFLPNSSMLSAVATPWNLIQWSNWYFCSLFFCWQVLSQSVAHALQKLKGPAVTTVITFIQTFDKFFDCLNVRSTREGYRKRKENLLPYKSIEDPRLQVCTFTIFLITCMHWKCSLKKCFVDFCTTY